MLRNYLLVALRNLLKHRLYSFINIGGLAVGLAACLLILLFVTDELSYDRWLPRSERLALFETEIRVPGRDIIEFGGSPGPLGPALAKDFSTDVEQVTRVYHTNESVKIGDRQFLTKVSYVDPNYFQVLDLPAVEGDRAKALANASSIALTRKQARIYFGDEPALGKVITVGDRKSVV
jgi:putative ABC transport system permease protein